MITCQEATAMGTYGSTSDYLNPIPQDKYEAGVQPLDSLPADWWNWLWQNITINEGRIVVFLNSIFSEINSVLSKAGVTPNTAHTDDLRIAIERLCAAVATSEVPGSVLSSSSSGKVAVASDGTASVNGLGTPSNLATNTKEVVSAINELVNSIGDGTGSSTITARLSSLETSVETLTNTYASTSNYGLVKVTTGNGLSISNGTLSLGPVCCVCSIASTSNETYQVLGVSLAGQPSCLYTPNVSVGTQSTGTFFRADMFCGNLCGTAKNATCFGGYTYECAKADILSGASGFPGYGTNVGCALGTASAGTSTCVARADHVHPISCCLMCGPSILAVSSPRVVAFGGGYCISASNGCFNVQLFGTDSYVGQIHHQNYCAVSGMCYMSITSLYRSYKVSMYAFSVLDYTLAQFYDALNACMGWDTACYPHSASFTSNAIMCISGSTERFHITRIFGCNNCWYMYGICACWPHTGCQTICRYAFAPNCLIKGSGIIVAHQDI